MVQASSSSLGLRRISGLHLSLSEPVQYSAFGTLTAQQNDPAITYLGGMPGMLGDTYPRYLFGGVFNITLDDGTRQGIGGTIAFQTDAQNFDFMTYGQGSPAQFDVFVDGMLIEGDTLAMPSDGSLRLVHVDFSAAGLSAGLHTVELAFNGNGAFGGLKLPTGSQLRAVSDPGPRIVFLGDSFTEGTGARSQGEDYAAITGRLLGSIDIWQSAFGATGYVTPFGNRPDLVHRIASDGVAAQGDVYAIAMGLNDGTSADLFAGVVSTLTSLTGGAPGAQIFVLGDWNPQAPTGRIYSEGVAAIRAAVGQFPGVHFLDPGGVAYSKIDPTHPDQAGHETLARWLTVQIRNTIGDPLQHSADLVLQDTSSSSVHGWQVAGDAVVGGGTYGTPGAEWSAMTTGSFFGDGRTDVLFHNYVGTLALWSTNGIELEGGGVIGSPGDGWDYRDTGDFNGDGRTDLLFENFYTNEYAIWDMKGTQVVGGGALGIAPGHVFAATGDLNGDGRTDIIFHDENGNLDAWLMSDTAIIGGGLIGDPGGIWDLKAAADFDGDGKDDLLFATNDGTYAVWTMDGTVITGGGEIGTAEWPWFFAKAVDLDQDGKADILFEDTRGTLASWLMSGTMIVGGSIIGTPPEGLTLI